MRVSAGFFEMGLSGKIRTYSFPPRFTWREIAVRAASICRAVTKPQVMACSPNSPKDTVVPPLETPRILPFCCLRHLTLSGANMTSSRRFSHYRLGQTTCPLGQNLALEDPALHADRAIGGVRLGGSIFDVGTKGVQRHAALVVPLITSHFRTAEAARTGQANPLGSELHGSLHRLFHGATEGNTALQLRGHVFRDQLRVGLGLAHLLDVEEYLAGGQRLDLLLQGLDARTTLAVDDARASRVDVDLDLVGRALDLDRGHARVSELLLDEFLQPQILVQPLRKILLRVPLRRPAADDPETKAYWIGFLTHLILLGNVDHDGHVGGSPIDAIGAPPT